MKLGTETGSLVNHVYANNSTQPEIGMGATILQWTDRTACTIIEISKSGLAVTVQRDNSVRLDKNGMSESQAYEYTPNPDGPRYVFKFSKKKGQWIEAGSKGKGNRLSIGSRREYHDYSF